MPAACGDQRSSSGSESAGAFASGAGSVLADGSVEVLAGLSGGEVIALDPVRAGLLRQKR